MLPRSASTAAVMMALIVTRVPPGPMRPLTLSKARPTAIEAWVVGGDSQRYRRPNADCAERATSAQSDSHPQTRAADRPG